MATSPQESGSASLRGGQFQNLSKFFAGHQTTLKAGSRTLEKERSGVGQFAKKPGVEPSCRASSGANAPERARQEISTRNHMTNAQLKNLVTEAVSLHREISEQNERLKTLKASLVREARLHENEFTATDNGGSRWTATGADGCIARVNFPAPSLLSLIDSESETFDQVLVLAGEHLDRLFESVYYLRPIEDFREEVSQTLSKREARQLIEVCQTKATPRVSFETAETKKAEK
jgi:hypothetical protein